MKRKWAALVFALVFPTALAWEYFVALASPVSATPEANAALQGAYFASKIVQFTFPLLWIGLCERRWLRPGRHSFRGAALGVGFGLLVGVALLGLYYGVRHSPLLKHTPENLRAKVAEFDAATPVRFLVLAGFISVLHSLLEEYYWRWFVFGELRRLLPLAAAMAVSSLSFMAHHLVVLNVYLPGRFVGATVPFALCIAVGGAVWAWLYHRSGSIYAPWLSHLLVDGAIMVVGYDLLFVLPPG